MEWVNEAIIRYDDCTTLMQFMSYIFRTLHIVLVQFEMTIKQDRKLLAKFSAVM